MDDLTFLWAVLGTTDGEFRLDAQMEDGSGWPTSWIGVGERRRFVGLIEHVGSELGRPVHVFPPRSARRPETVRRIGCLWVVLESGKQVQAARRLPAPTLALRDGRRVKRVLFWSLDRELDMRWGPRALRRVAHAVSAPKKWADPEAFWFVPPGVGDWVVSARNEGAVYQPRELVGRLRDAPDPKAWRDRTPR